MQSVFPLIILYYIIIRLYICVYVYSVSVGIYIYVMYSMELLVSLLFYFSRYVIAVRTWLLHHRMSIVLAFFFFGIWHVYIKQFLYQTLLCYGFCRYDQSILYVRCSATYLLVISIFERIEICCFRFGIYIFKILYIFYITLWSVCGFSICISD